MGRKTDQDSPSLEKRVGGGPGDVTADLVDHFFGFDGAESAIAVVLAHYKSQIMDYMQQIFDALKSADKSILPPYSAPDKSIIDGLYDFANINANGYAIDRSAIDFRAINSDDILDFHRIFSPITGFWVGDANQPSAQPNMSYRFEVVNGNVSDITFETADGFSHRVWSTQVERDSKLALFGNPDFIATARAIITGHDGREVPTNRFIFLIKDRKLEFHYLTLGQTPKYESIR